MTHQTNEELKTKLYKIMSKDLVLSAKTHIEVMNAINEIMSLIPQPEHLDVNLIKTYYKDTTDKEVTTFYAVEYRSKDFKSEQEFKEFLRKHNLKAYRYGEVTNEECE